MKIIFLDKYVTSEVPQGNHLSPILLYILLTISQKLFHIQEFYCSPMMQKYLENLETYMMLLNCSLI